MPFTFWTYRVYPRVYGGTCRHRIGIIPPVGLSPRVRGNPGAKKTPAREVGSIPACTGEPFRALRARRFSRVYPRVYGGTSLPRTCFIPTLGLSPRVRGNPDDLERGPADVGSIPACTGEPAPYSRGSTTVTVYPRVYGGTVSRRKGSRVRGEPYQRRRTPRSGRVYPRVYGGTIPRVGIVPPSLGLSPRVRGNPL